MYIYGVFTKEEVKFKLVLICMVKIWGLKSKACMSTKYVRSHILRTSLRA